MGSYSSNNRPGARSWYKWGIMFVCCDWGTPFLCFLANRIMERPFRGKVERLSCSRHCCHWSFIKVISLTFSWNTFGRKSGAAPDAPSSPALMLMSYWSGGKSEHHKKTKIIKYCKVIHKSIKREWKLFVWKNTNQVKLKSPWDTVHGFNGWKEIPYLPPTMYYSLVIQSCDKRFLKTSL